MANKTIRLKVASFIPQQLPRKFYEEHNKS